MDIIEPIARSAAGAVVPELPARDAARAAEVLVVPTEVTPAPAAEDALTLVDPLTSADPVTLVQPAAPPAPPTVVDHVRAHAVACYWDHLECRWACSS
jgi:hypothetical protein